MLNSVQDLHIDFNIKFQNLGTQSYNRLQSEVIDWVLNYYQIQYIKELCSIKQEKRLEYLPSSVIEKIRPFITSIEKDIIIGIDETKEITIESDYLAILAQSGECTTMFKNKSFEVPCRLIDNESLIDVINDYCSTSTYQSPLSKLEGNTIFITTKNIKPKEKFTISRYKYIYIKQPSKISLSDNKNTEFPIETRPDIVDGAVILAKRLVDTNRLDEVVNQPVNMEN